MAVIRQPAVLVTVLALAATLLLATLAVACFAGLSSDTVGWLLLLGAAGILATGSLSNQAVRKRLDALVESQQKAVLLETQLVEQRAAIDALADGLDVGLFICDARATIQYANRRAMDMFQFNNPLGRTVLAVTFSGDLERLVEETSTDGESRRAEVTFTYPVDRVGIAKSWCPADAQNRVFLSIYEITDLRRLERVRQDFVANVSHELRTPMTIIRAMAETLLDADAPPPSDQAKRFLTKMVSEVDRLSSISQDLLILSAAESNPVRKHACDIAEVFRAVMTQLESSARQKGLAIDYKGPESCHVEANTSQMTQVAINLIQNAISYTNTGSIKVNLSANEDQVSIAVSDTGMGISSDHLPRVFERFYRVDKARSRNTGGTGLGLSIVRHIVESHGGKVTVQSQLNRGSTFTVTLPIGDPDVN